MDDSHIRSVRKVNQDSFGLTLPKPLLDELNEELDIDVKSCNVVIDISKQDDGSVVFELEVLE